MMLLESDQLIDICNAIEQIDNPSDKDKECLKMATAATELWSEIDYDLGLIEMISDYLSKADINAVLRKYMLKHRDLM